MHQMWLVHRAGIAETYLMKAIGQCTGQTLAQVKAAAQKAGDLGQVAHSARAKQRTMMAPAKLTCRKVFAALKEIAHMTGQMAPLLPQHYFTFTPRQLIKTLPKYFY